MEATEAQLAKRFAAMEDEALLAMASDPDDLTELATTVLHNELRSRRLQTPPSKAREKQTSAPDASIVTLRRFAALPEALAARGALEHAGIDCFLRDENTVRTLWHLSNLIGGTRLDVLEDDLEAAEAVLLKLDAEEAHIPLEENVEEMLGEPVLCPRCGSIEVNRIGSLAGFGTMAGWLLGRRIRPADQQWRCNACLHEWVDNSQEPLTDSPVWRR